MAEGDTLANALVGAVVAIFLTFLPLSPLLGGLVAGYLQGGSRGDGVRVGVVVGVVTFLPVVGFGLMLFGFGAFYLVGGMPLHLGVAGIVLVGLFLLVLFGAYTVGLAALGGWLGNYVLTDTDLGRPRDRSTDDEVPSGR